MKISSKITIFATVVLAIILVLFLIGPKELDRTIDIKNQNYSTYSKVQPRFLSFALDMGQVLGGKWWEGSMAFEGGRGGTKTTPFDFNRAELDRLVSPLAPFTLRLGGSEADSVLYELNSNRTKLTKEELDRGFQTILNKERILSIKDFVSRNNLELLLTLNIGPGYRSEDGLDYEAMESFLINLSKVMPELQLFELGNEINAFFLNYGIKGQISMEEYAKDYREVKKLIRKHFPLAKLAGPANAFWPILGEVFSTFTMNSIELMNELKDELDIYTWHYYPTQSDRCPVQVEKATRRNMLDAIQTREYLNQAQSVVEEAKKNSITEVWLGETGPAQCGGQPKVSQSFESAMWFFDHIFKTLQSGQNKLIRQTIVGSDYGLINDKSLTANFDYYVARLFKNLSPTVIFNSTKGAQFSFCDPQNHLYHAFTLRHDRTIQIDSKAYVSASLDERFFFSLTPTNFDEKLTGKFRSIPSNDLALRRHTINLLKTLDPSDVCKNAVR
ncbi:MAG: hypothetical protein KC478_08465 [Bacteriovoracaceae bacterium]|nr:hypothetical protein [Bacteriovoracaceae bacterium]